MKKALLDGVIEVILAVVIGAVLTVLFGTAIFLCWMAIYVSVWGFVLLAGYMIGLVLVLTSLRDPGK